MFHRESHVFSPKPWAPQEEEAEERIPRQLRVATLPAALTALSAAMARSTRLHYSNVIFTVCTQDPCVPNRHSPVREFHYTC